jgi:hypothetical protein
MKYLTHTNYEQNEQEGIVIVYDVNPPKRTNFGGAERMPLRYQCHLGFLFLGSQLVLIVLIPPWRLYWDRINATSPLDVGL